MKKMIAKLKKQTVKAFTLVEIRVSKSVVFSL